MVRRIVYLFSLLLFWASLAVAQRGGIPTFTATDTFENDTINLTTLTPVVHFGLLSKGAGTSISVESPQSCHVVGLNTYCGYQTNLLPGFFFVPHELLSLQAVGTISSAGGCNTFTVNSFMGLDGVTSYPISQVVIYQNTGCGAITATATTIDGSGITGTFGYPTVGSTSAVTSAQTPSGWTFSNSTGKVKDPFSNTMVTWTGPGGSFTDGLGAATTLGNGAQGYGSPSSYGYTDTGGNSQTISLVAGTATSFEPLSGTGCGTNNAGTSVTPVSSITFPDSTSISITWDTNNSGIDGMIKSFTNRNGGTITYTYGTVTCAGWYFNTLSRQTSDGTTSYSASYASGITTTTVKDPGLNKTVYTFFTNGSPAAPSQTSTIDRYQNTGTVASPTYTHISETQYCYNTHSCSAAPTYPITQLDTYEYTYNGATQVQMSHDVKTYDSTYGLLLTDAATDSITSQTITTTYVYGTDSSGTCVAITNTAVVDHPCTITTKNGSTWLSGSTYSYNSNGALTSSSACLSNTCTGSSALTTTYTPNTNGTYSAIQDPNGQTTNYTYGSCNSLMPTDVTTTVNSVAIDHKATWNCDAGLTMDTTDANSNEADYTYDSMNRLHTYHDYMGDTNTTTYDYGTPTLDHVKVTDNLGVISYHYVDGLGRSLIDQVYPGTGTNYDTVSHTYGWNSGTNFQITTSGGSSSAACSTTLDTACTTTTLTALVNPIAGPYKTTDANSGTVTYAVNSKDFSVTAGPAPSGEHTKVIQAEVDGFGRVNSTCALENTGGTACGQTMGNSGVLTSSTFSYATGSYEVDTTRGVQTHKVFTDAVGRTTKTVTPEAGTTTFTYDTINDTLCGNTTSKGDLVSTTDAASNEACPVFDGLHRIYSVGTNNQGATNPCKRFRYDSTANKFLTAPTGYPSSGANLIGRLMEAETDSCGGSPTTYTDEWFAYDKMGRMTDMWESTPNSSGYYHTTATYDADGNVLTIGGLAGISTLTYIMDGEGRPLNAELGTTWVIGSSSTTGVSYDAAGAPLTIPIGSGGGSDTYTYDSMENMKTYTFAGNSKSDAGTLTWNSIGSLGQLAISDTYNSNDSQTCAYAYDDVARIASVTSPTGKTCNATETYTNDQYDNLTQSGTFSWTSTASSTNNQTTGSTYDSDGNTLTDGVNTYTWNAYGKMASARSGNSGAVCGTSGNCQTYDAFGRLAEVNAAGSFSPVMYGPTGLLGIAGYNAYLPVPGGGILDDIGGTLYYLHPDWLGTKRLATKVSDGSLYGDAAYAPYSQQYNLSGTLPGDFTGDVQIALSGLWDTPNRELLSNSGRWLSPEFSGSWNGYSYPTDPNTQTDPSGLDPQGPVVKVVPFPDCRPDNPCKTQELPPVSGPSQLDKDVKDFANLQGHEASNVPGNAERHSLFGLARTPIPPEGIAGLNQRECQICERLYRRSGGEGGEEGGRMYIQPGEASVRYSLPEYNAAAKAFGVDPLDLMAFRRTGTMNRDFLWDNAGNLRAVYDLNPGDQASWNISVGGKTALGPVGPNVTRELIRNFESGEEEMGSSTWVLFAAQVADDFKNSNSPTRVHARWLLNALGDTSYGNNVYCNDHGCSSSW